MPFLSGRLPLRRPKEVLERHVRPRALGVREELVAVEELAMDIKASIAVLDELGADRELTVDVNRAPVANRESRRDRREPVPGGKQAARLVQRRSHEAAVDESRSGLVLLAKRERRRVRR
jgi:hypothetical protein